MHSLILMPVSVEDDTSTLVLPVAIVDFFSQLSGREQERIIVLAMAEASRRPHSLVFFLPRGTQVSE